MWRLVWGALALLIALFATSSSVGESIAVRRHPCHLTFRERFVVNLDPLGRNILERMERAGSRCLYAKFKSATVGVMALEPLSKLPEREEFLSYAREGYTLSARPVTFRTKKLGSSDGFLVVSEAQDHPVVFTLAYGIRAVLDGREYVLSLGFKGSRRTHVSVDEISRYIDELYNLLAIPPEGKARGPP